MRKSSCFKAIAGLLCLVIATAIFTGCAKEDAAKNGEKDSEKKVITLRISGGQPESAPMIQYINGYFCDEVAKQVAEKTDYKIEWMKGWAGSMVKLGEALEGAEAGIVDIGVVVIPLEPAKAKLWNMFYYMPFASYDSTVGVTVINKMTKKYPEFKNIF